MYLPLKIRLKLIRQRIYAALLPGEKVVTISGDGGDAVIHVSGREIYAPSPWRWKLYRRGWESRLDQLSKEYGVPRHFELTPQSVVLDIGANAGEFAHVCARYDASVHCFEPDPAARRALEKNIIGLKNTTAHGLAIWKEDGVVGFGQAPDFADSSVFVDDNQVSVKAATIASFCRDNAIGHIDLIKCDAEGAEPEVLQGARGVFDRIGGIALDTGAERMGQRTHEDCAQILSENNFQVIEEKVGKRWMTYGVRAS